MQFEKERANDVVESRAQSAAGHNAGARFLRVEKKFRARPGQFELQSRFRADLDSLRECGSRR